jgi:hypothetical protein
MSLFATLNPHPFLSRSLFTQVEPGLHRRAKQVERRCFLFTGQVETAASGGDTGQPQQQGQARHLEHLIRHLQEILESVTADSDSG